MNQSLNLKLNAVIFATDFSDGSVKAGAYAAYLADSLGAELFVVHAFTLTQAGMEVEAEKLLLSTQRKELAALLGETAAQLKADRVAIPVLLDGEPRDVIPRLADRHAPALVVLGTHGGGRLERGFIGSTAERILRSTRWPALTVGPHARAATAENVPFRRILFATDFTTAAAEAAVFAVPLAKWLGAEMDVLHIVREESIAEPGQLAELRNRFCSAVAGLSTQPEFCNPQTFVAAGRAHDRILEHIRKREIDLLVLGIRQTSHLSMEMRTSGAFQIIADAPCPVLTIRR